MPIELTEQQHVALAQAGEAPAVVVDPASNATYVLIPAALYEAIRARLEAEDEIASIREMYPHIGEVMKEDWEDPAMDVYDEGLPHDPAR